VSVLFCSCCARSNQAKKATSRKLSEKVRENYSAKVKDKLGEDANPYYVGLQAKPKLWYRVSFPVSIPKQ